MIIVHRGRKQLPWYHLNLALPLREKPSKAPDVFMLYRYNGRTQLSLIEKIFQPAALGMYSSVFQYCLAPSGNSLKIRTNYLFPVKAFFLI